MEQGADGEISISTGKNGIQPQPLTEGALSQQEPEDCTDRDADEETLLQIRKPPAGLDWLHNLHSALVLIPLDCLAQQG